MKQFRFSLLCLLLSLVLILSLAGCRQEPADPTNGPTPTTAPTQPTDPAKPTNPSIPTDPTNPTTPVPQIHPAEAYIQAAKELESLDSIYSAISVSTTMSVGRETYSFTTKINTLRSHRNTQSPRFRVDYSTNLDLKASSYYLEEYIDGILYVDFDNSQYTRFCGPADPAEYAAQVLPVTPIDPDLYNSISAFEDDSRTVTYEFTQPSAAESWALPEGAELLDAFGSAIINRLGKLEESRYEITYRYGGVLYTDAYHFRSQANYAPVTLTGDPETFHSVQSPEAIRMVSRMWMAASAYKAYNSATVSSTSSIFTQAAGVAINQTAEMDWYHGNSARLVTDVYQMNYATGQEQTYTLEEYYKDKTYTAIENGGTPVSYPNVSFSSFSTYFLRLLDATLPKYPSDYENVDFICTDLGSTILVEIVYDEKFAEQIQGEICQDLWQEANFLNNLASKYVTNEITGYFAIDKYTGFPTAAGYYYSGTHTIEGTDYLLTAQLDQSFEIPGAEACYNIFEKQPYEVKPAKNPTPLFYHVTGKDGQEMWLFGTIHIGDDRTAYLPKEIYDALAASDALALECDNELFEKLSETDEALQAQLSEVYFLPDGTTLESVLGEELYEMALKYMKASGNYNMNAPYMKPFAWNSALTDFQAQQSYALVRSQGVESRLTALAKEQNKPILEIESAMFQLQMMANFSPELQIYMLMSTLHTDTLQAREELLDLYEKWCAGDEAALRKAVSTQVDTSGMTAEEKAEYEQYKYLIDEYNKAMDGDRNKGMLEVAKSYLESDQVVFYAVGLAHLLSEDGGLVDALRAAGYTVELVQYK